MKFLVSNRQSSLFALSVSLVLLFNLTACGGGGGSTNSSSVALSSAVVSSVSSATSSVNSSLAIASSSSTAQASSDANVIATDLHTWWHDDHEINDSSAVADNKVRRSGLYDVRVARVAAPAALKNAFVYMSIPRSGRSKAGYTHADGAEFADLANLSMSWSSFLYTDDVWVEVDLKDGASINNLDEIIIRPTSLNFEKQLVDNNTLRIKVPYRAEGYRFSVEFESQQFTSYNDRSGDTGNLSLNDSGYAIHREPKNALLIFAQPNYTAETRAELVPQSGNIQYPAQGLVDAASLNADIIYFKPGIYHMGANKHAFLPNNTRWIYLAPGAYVKGSFQFRNAQENYKVTGYGVLSGEQYVYEADINNNYQHRLDSSNNCHETCVKMLRFESASRQQQLRVQGITINEPPYHSFVVYGNEDTFAMNVSEYQQVGSWFWQTDGLEFYTGSEFNNGFFHANDDVLKFYHSNVTVDNVVVWKNENGPVIQFGWWPRHMSNITAKNIDVIHNRMYWKDQKHNTCVINSANNWIASGDTWDKTADLSKYVRNLMFENIRVEGMVNCAMRFYPLSNFEGINIHNLDIERWNELPNYSQYSLLQAMGNSAGTKVNITPGNGINIVNYTVAGQPIVKTDNSSDNWSKDNIGRIDFDATLNTSWSAVATIDAACTGQTITTSEFSDLTINQTLDITATSSAALPLEYAISGAASIAPTATGATITAAAASGEAIVRITQAGDSEFCPSSFSAVINVIDPAMGPGNRWIGASWKAWSPSQLPMNWNAQDSVYELTTDIPAGEQQLKFTNTDNWSGDDWGNATGLSGTASLTTGGGDNVSFTVTTAGNYLIRFDPYNFTYAITPL